MIEKMKMVYIVTTASGKEDMLRALRDLGIMHLAEKQSEDRELTERFQTLSRTEMALKEYSDPKQKKIETLSEEEFSKVYSDVLEAIDARSAYAQEISDAKSEIDRVSDWGDFSPADVAELRESGFDFHFYRISDAEYQVAAEDEDIRLIKLSPIGKMNTVAVIGTLPPEIQATELALPEKSISEYEEDITRCEAGMEECNETLKAASVYDASFKQEMLKMRNEMNFSAASATAHSDDDFVWLSGYIPEDELDKFRDMAAAQGCAWGIDDVDEEDLQVPTKLRYNKVSKLIKPIYDILGIQPGYNEQDVSLWFFLFFILFFAMIIGDGGYGVLILITTIAMSVRKVASKDARFLLYVLSIGTIGWGAVTGTWFGMKSAMEIPLLRSLVVPSIATYPEYFGITSTETQFAIMKFSLSVGVVQLVLGTLLSIKKKAAEKDLSLIADVGWMIAVIAMYMLSLNLVIGEDVSLKPVFIGIGIAFVTVVLFGGMTPGATFGQSIKAGLAGSFTTFLDTISCFSNVMSYIRLFAVGMAGVAISQSFNDIGGGMPGIFIVIGAVIILLGHALNIAMCFLSVVVHGVRLNVLEFSGQAGIEWAGVPYEPFKEVE